MPAERDLHRLFGNIQSVEVGMSQVCDNGSLKQLAVSQGTYLDESFQQRIIGIYICTYHSVAHMSGGFNSVEVVVAVTEAVYCCRCLQL